MTTEEVNKPASLPPYPEMILAAIDGLKDPNGSNKSAISNYIESTYGNLPEAHGNLLTENLNTMKENGDLVQVKNNYMRGGSVTPAKRGRGRPPKPKSGDVAAPATGTPRPRGRPPKPKDPLGVVATPPKVASAGRGRGRPPKEKKEEKETEETTEGDDTVTTTTVVGPVTGASPSPRPRGRPPKAKSPAAAVGAD